MKTLLIGLGLICGMSSANAAESYQCQSGMNVVTDGKQIFVNGELLKMKTVPTTYFAGLSILSAGRAKLPTDSLGQSYVFAGFVMYVYQPEYGIPAATLRCTRYQ